MTSLLSFFFSNVLSRKPSTSLGFKTPFRFTINVLIRLKPARSAYGRARGTIKPELSESFFRFAIDKSEHERGWNYETRRRWKLLRLICNAVIAETRFFVAKNTRQCPLSFSLNFFSSCFCLFLAFTATAIALDLRLIRIYNRTSPSR